MTVTPETTPYVRIGGEEAVTRLVKRFYDHMAEHEPALARLHAHDEQGRVLPEGQEKFRLFLLGWLGGPQTYQELYGHPRLRMRHARVAVDVAMRDAWMRSMRAALVGEPYPADLVAFLDRAFAQLADFMRNQPA